MTIKTQLVAVILFCLLVMQISPVCLANVAGLGQIKENICAFIEAGKLNEARIANKKLLADFNDEPNLSDILCLIAFKYEGASNFDEAKSNFQQIIDRYPGSPVANKAQMGKSRADAMSLIMSQKFDEAKTAVDKMASDFTGNPELPEAIYWIAERYERIGKFEEAKNTFQKVIQNHTSSTWASKARLSMSRAETMAFIIAEKYDLAQKALDKMAVDFAGEQGLPGALYWTTERFERFDRFEEAKRNYQKILQNFPQSPYAGRARLGISRVEVMSLVKSHNYEQAQSAIDKMLIDFTANPSLPGTLYWLTEKYENNGKFDEAKRVYQQIIQKFPDSVYKDRARLGVRRVDVMALMESQYADIAEEALNKMIADFKDNPELPRAVFTIGGKCFTDARTPDYRQRALKAFEKVMNELPCTETIAGMYADLYYCAGRCYSEIEDYPKALNCFEKIAGEYPDYIYSWYAQFMAGSIHQSMKDKGLIDSAQADIKTRAAYEALLTKHPTCSMATTAQYWLNQHISQ